MMVTVHTLTVLFTSPVRDALLKLKQTGRPGSLIFRQVYIICRYTGSTLRMCARACARACCPVMISMKTIIGFEFPGPSRRLGGRETGDVDSLPAHGH